MALTPSEILDVLRRVADTTAPLWLTGGVAVEFLVGRWTRPHKDIDLVAFDRDRALLERELGERGFSLIEGGGWTTRWRSPGPAGGDLEIVLVEAVPPDTGALVIRAGDPAGGRPCRVPFLPGYLDPRRVYTLDGVSFRVCSAEGEWLARIRSGDLVAGRRPEPKLEHDRLLLEPLVDEARRRELAPGR